LPADDLPAATAALVGRLARGPALAYSLLKRGLRRSATADLDAVLELEAQYQQIAGRSDDFREGLEAFVAKRPPAFRES
jgi:2-(1,2-epoxy-1,2-dihydrophenyl)acetyl-CoA isomerase